MEIASSRKAFGYGAIESNQKRRKPVTKTASELHVLTGPKRQTASATAREDRRNFTVLAWMVRRHLDNVSRFTPHFRLSGDSPEVKEVNRIVKLLLDWHSRARNFDVLCKHGRDEWVRMFEACKILSGDAGGLKVMGGKLQGIEGDRLAIPGSGLAEINGKPTEDGIIYNTNGTRKAWILCKRVGSRGETLEYERTIDDADLIFDAYWPERFDSDRGVSPLLTALAECADVKETREWLVLKAKAAALFGFAFTRKGSDEMPPFASQIISESAADAPTSQATSYASKMADAINSRGIVNLDLDPGDDVKSIESSTPNPSVVEFTRELIRSVLLALDIPFTFYDSLTASFSARIADRNEYEESCEWKRAKNINVLDQIYGGWLLKMWSDSDKFGFGKALKKAAISVEEVGAILRWVPAGRPWLDRTNEMSGHILALSAGVTSVPRICSAYGEDAYEIAEEQKEYLDKCGIPILYAQGGQVPVNDILKGAVINGNDKTAK
jgi:capsid protein